MRHIAAVAAVVTLLAFAAPARAQAWTKPSRLETGMLVASELAIAADLVQTLTIVRNHLPETNPLLGKYPSAFRASATIGLAMLGTGALWYLLPTPWRDLVVIEVFAVEAV